MRRPLLLRSAPFAVLAAAVVGCAVDPSPATTGRPFPGASSPAGALEPEATRVQRFLDARYSATDVRHSFRTLT
jgi:hypothetical protein